MAGENSDLAARDHASKKLRLEQKVAIDEACSAGDDEGAGKESKVGETVTHLLMEENMHTHIEGQDPNEASCGKEVFCMQEAVMEALSVDGGHINGDASTSAHMETASKEACSVAEGVIHGDDATSVHMGKTLKEASVGPRRFTSSTDMLNFFNQLLNGWPLNHDINKYEHMMLEDLLKKGHPDSCEKIGTGVQAFQVRINKEFDSRCFYVIRKDGSINDFSYRKCVDNILSLPKNLKSKFGRERTRKGCGAHQNGNAHVVSFKSQHITRGRDSKLGGNGRQDQGGSGHTVQGRGNASRQRRNNYSEQGRGFSSGHR